MPRPKKPGAGEPKRRSRNGCWPCKSRKIKCGEEKPNCVNCDRQGDTCDYSIRLSWGGRTKRSLDEFMSPSDAPNDSLSSHIKSASFEEKSPSTSGSHNLPEPSPKRKVARHTRSQSAASAPSNISAIDPKLIRMDSAESLPHLAPEDSFQPTFQEAEIRTQTTFMPTNPRNLHPTIDYPSPSTSSFESPIVSAGSCISFYTDSPSSMPPPSRGTPLPTILDQLDAGLLSRAHRNRHQRSYSAESSAVATSHSPITGVHMRHMSYMSTPLTPNSPAGFEDSRARGTPSQPHETFADPRHLPVPSLLHTASETSHSPQRVRRYPIEREEYTVYGYDLGLPDIDTPRNDDLGAITSFSPPVGVVGLDNQTQNDTVRVKEKDIAFERHGYYAKPVPIRIAKSLEPLPALLLENPMNLLYFHHFINHTARILVPHDCERNPFRNILPEMAIKNDNILSLLLAYSASHRACMLNHPEPVNRIALWVRDVFPRLRESIAAATDPSAITNSTLAPAIMMASLEIISPNTFEVPISWQNHLTMARQMIIARGGPRSMDRSDHVAYFLSRWFAYLDVLGSLSGNKNDQPLGSFYWNSENASADEDFQIDCLTGFTNRCVGSLARISELAKRVEPFRIGSDGNVLEDFQPSADIIAQADRIRRDLQEGLTSGLVFKGCNHRASSSSSSTSSPTTSEGAWDATEIYATNEMFHWAGLIHLYRRVLNYPSTHPSVQGAVREIVGLLYKVRRGSTAEACLLFPMFAAGCDAQDVGQREKIAERLKSVEGFGMTQVGRARGLMQRVWETGKAWESLVEGEFFG
ncbi:unnamed protein product [Periconia digitata]|uniref:Zn(2)-C6 fungal-type domain-containing protein n=1 Tax=Periconia digitata TaxID=1303443 RepID=A0A9W4USQ2_9PLEO|nr:unnamed protein product [Periconia digitata]